MADARRAPARTPPRPELRAAALWCARLLVGDGGAPYAGPIRVRVCRPEECEELVVRSTAAADTPPAWLALGEEAGAGAGASAAELLRSLLSPDESKILADLLAHQPCSASSVQDRCRAVVGKSEFWCIWGQLQGRRLVEQRDDDRYQVGPEWLARLLTKGEPGGRGRPADGGRGGD
jgi:hypothetical protein